MPRAKGTKNRATLAAEAAFREQIIKEHEANRAAEKPPEAPPTPKEVATVIVQRETLDLGSSDDKPKEPEAEQLPSAELQPESEADEESLDLEPPVNPKRFKAPVRQEESPKKSLDKPATRKVASPPTPKPAKTPQPPKSSRSPSWRLGSKGT